MFALFNTRCGRLGRYCFGNGGTWQWVNESCTRFWREETAYRMRAAIDPETDGCLPQDVEVRDITKGFMYSESQGMLNCNQIIDGVDTNKQTNIIMLTTFDGTHWLVYDVEDRRLKTAKLHGRLVP